MCLVFVILTLALVCCLGAGVVVLNAGVGVVSGFVVLVLDTPKEDYTKRLLASSPAYRSQAFVFERAYGLQFHLEVSPELAAEWGEVPAYSASLETIKGPGALDRLVVEVTEHAEATLPLARDLFGRWLEHVVRVPAQTFG